MISPSEIEGKARKLWATGRPLRSLLQTEDEPLFPYAIAFRRPTAQEWLDRFAQLRAASEDLRAGSKDVRGFGYSVEYREAAHQKLGRIRIPERVVIGSVDDLAQYIGEVTALRIFRDLIALLTVREPRLLTWLAQRPFMALESHETCARLLDTVACFQANPRPNRFARELGIPGVDSKFVETNRAVLAEWLERLLPEPAIDLSVSGLADRGFERRYGLRFEEPVVRFRWLDPSRRLAGSISDAAVPLSELASYAPACDRVLVTENKINFLTLPERAATLAIFGSGYAVDLLKSIPWLGRQPLYYWGDLDTHGFSVLSRLRMHWPQARSFLMDRDTLLAHSNLWSEEPVDRRCLKDLPGLEEHEQMLYDDLRFDRLGIRVRLEQERISQERVERAVRSGR